MKPNSAIYPSLRGKSVFVTGGASGIGAALVRGFARQESRVSFVDVDQNAAERLICDLAQEGLPAPWFRRCDLRDIEALRTSLEKAGCDNGDVTVLVNNAADDTRHALADLTTENWDDRIAVNLRPMVFAVQSVAGQMRRAGGGSIINFGSISWKAGMGGMVGYTTAKAAVHGLTRTLARELGPAGIRVNTVSPGWVMTERQLRLWVDEAGNREMDEKQCLKVRLQPEDIAAMVLFLASDDARYCTAQDFTVDAGWT